MSEKTEYVPNIQGLSFTPNRISIVQRSPSNKNETAQIISLGMGRREVVSQAEEHKWTYLTNIIKTMY